MFKVNTRNTGTRCEICSKLTIKTPERQHWRRSGVFIVNFELVNVGWEHDSLDTSVNLRFIRRSQDLQDVLMLHVRSIYVLCPGRERFN